MHTLNTLHSIPSASRRGRFLLFLIFFIPLLLFDKPLSADETSAEFNKVFEHIRASFMGATYDTSQAGDPCKQAALQAAREALNKAYVSGAVKGALSTLRALLESLIADPIPGVGQLRRFFDLKDIYDALTTGEGFSDFLKRKAIEKIGEESFEAGKGAEFLDNWWKKIEEELAKQKDELVDDVFDVDGCPVKVQVAWDKSRRREFPDFGLLTIYIWGDCNCKQLKGVRMKKFMVRIYGRAVFNEDFKLEGLYSGFDKENIEADCDCPEERETSLGDAVGEGAIDMAILGRDKTTAMAMRLTNKTEDRMSVVVPTGTPLEPGSKDHQPYQTGYIPPIELGPGETETVEVPAFCTDSEKEPAPKDGSVTYTLHEGPLTPEQEKITEIIVVTNTLKQLHETCGKVAEPDDFLVAVAGGPPPVTVPTPREFPKPPVSPGPPEPEVYGPPPPPEKPEPEVYGPGPEHFDRLRHKYIPYDEHHGPMGEVSLFLIDVSEWLFFLSVPRSAPKEWDEDEDFGGIPEPPPGPPEPAPPEGFEVPPGTIVLPPDVILLSLSGPLEFPGTTQFTLAEVPELKTNISSRKEKGEAVFSNPTGKVAVSMSPTEDPNIVKFDITKLEARSPSFKALGKSRGDINMALNSPEKSTGTLNIKTGEVRGTVSVKAWGKKYKEPFPAAAYYTGRFDIPTKKLSLNLRGISFEPVDLEEGLYQRIRPEKFWDAVMLYSIWKETNDQGKEELRKVMTEQLRADFPKERAEGLSALVAEEIVHRVDEVHDRHKKLKKEETDFSILDPTLKLRKT